MLNFGYWCVSRVSCRHLVLTTVNNLRYHSSDRFRRGLIIDQKTGNVLKIDRHKYVRKAYHGLKELDTAEKKVAYTNIHGPAFNDLNYVNIDTMFTIIGERIIG